MSLKYFVYNSFFMIYPSKEYLNLEIFSFIFHKEMNTDIVLDSIKLRKNTLSCESTLF